MELARDRLDQEPQLKKESVESNTIESKQGGILCASEGGDQKETETINGRGSAARGGLGGRSKRRERCGLKKVGGLGTRGGHLAATA